MTQDDVIPPDCRINVKLVGEIDVAGMTTEDLEKLLVKKTSDQLKNPEVVVSVTRFTEKLVYVGGEVVRPGTLPYRRGLTPLQAVAASGGFRDTARTRQRHSVAHRRLGAELHGPQAQSGPGGARRRQGADSLSPPATSSSCPAPRSPTPTSGSGSTSATWSRSSAASASTLDTTSTTGG